MKIRQLLILVGGLLLVLVLLLSWNNLFPSKIMDLRNTTSGSLPGIQTSGAPWQPELAHLRERLIARGLPALAVEGSALHIHQHLDLNINGSRVPVPAEIGINQTEGFISPIHVHDASGIIHVESPTIREFTLGQFFDIWGVRFSSSCVGGYCSDGTNSLKVYSNGTLVSGDPRNLVLTSHQEIMVAYGTSTPTIISNYTFPAGY